MFKIKHKGENSITPHLLAVHEEERLALFRKIPVNNQGFVLLNAHGHIREDIMNKLENEEISVFLHYLDIDETTDLLQKLPTRRRKKIISQLSQNIREKVEFLVKFDPKSAAGLMDVNYVQVSKGMTFTDVYHDILKHEHRTGKFPVILVVDKGFLVGELPGHILVMRHPKQRIDKDIRKVPSIFYDKDQNEVINLFKTHPHNKIVVLDEDKSIIGVIYSDDIIKIIQESQAQNLYNFAGLSQEESVLDNARKKVQHRYKWLIINLGTAFLAASVVGLFHNTIEKFVLLAAYMPIIAGMGGNTATQTLAVVVRGITLREIELKTAGKTLLNEAMAGATNGFINAIIVAFIAVIFNKSPLLGLVAGIAMITNLTVAGFFGTLIPLIMKKLGKDPATSATIFITTCTDVLGFFTFLGLASVILK